MSDNEGVRRAKRATASVVAESPFPKTYDELHDLLALSYLRGATDELRHMGEPAEVAAAIVNDANRSTLREVRRDDAS